MSSAPSTTTCPGCGLELPAGRVAPYGGDYRTSDDCWSVYTEVLGAEFGDALVFGRVHQLTVDAYALQHAGPPHPDKSVAVHLAGLHLALEEGVPPPAVPRRLQRLVAARPTWPHFEPPERTGELDVLHVALAGTPAEHVARAGAWAREVWAAWSPAHASIAELVARHLGPPDRA